MYGDNYKPCRAVEEHRPRREDDVIGQPAHVAERHLEAIPDEAEEFRHSELATLRESWPPPTHRSRVCLNFHHLTVRGGNPQFLLRSEQHWLQSSIDTNNYSGIDSHMGRIDGQGSNNR